MSATDAALLSKWIRKRDAQAFAEIVTRHAGMVYGTSRRILRNPADAEDIAQECFLALSQAERPMERSVGGWLHRVAANRSLSRLRAEARRDARDQAYADAAPVATVVHWDDLREHVDEAVVALPDELRTPVVLYFFEGRSHAEIGRAVGITRSAASKRIARGIEAMRDQLKKRGVTVGAAALSTLLIEHGVEAAPKHLVESLSAFAVASQVSPLVSMAPRIFRIAAGALVSALLVAVGVLYIIASMAREENVQAEKRVLQSPQSRPPEPISTAAASSDVKTAEEQSTSTKNATSPLEGFSVVGRVVDESGKPIPDAQLVLYHQDDDRQETERLIEQTYSSDTGEFQFPTRIQFNDIVRNPHDPENFLIFATQSGYALGWQSIERNDFRDWYEIVLTEPVSEVVSVRDSDGRPIEGARVWYAGVSNPMVADPELEEGFYLRSVEGALVQTSDSSGYARFDALPKGKSYFHGAKPGFPMGLTFYPSTTIVLVDAATVSGRVVDEAGKGVSDVDVYFKPPWYGSGDWARTGLDGFYEFSPLRPKGWDMSAWGVGRVADGDYDVSIVTDDYVTTPLEVLVEPGDDIRNLDIVALRGVEIKCSVVQEGTFEPMPAGAELRIETQGRHFAARTEADGIARFRVLPGLTTVVLHAPPSGVYLVNSTQINSLQDGALQIDAAPPKVEVTFEVGRIGGKVANLPVTIIGMDAPTNDLNISGRVENVTTIHGFMGSVLGGVLPDGTFGFSDVPLGQVMHVYAFNNDLSLAAFFALDVPSDIGSTSEIEINLEPTVSTELEAPPEWIAIGGRLTASPKGAGRASSHPYDVISKTKIRMDGLLPNIEYQVTFNNADPKDFSMRWRTRKVKVVN